MLRRLQAARSGVKDFKFANEGLHWAERVNDEYKVPQVDGVRDRSNPYEWPASQHSPNDGGGILTEHEWEKEACSDCCVEELPHDFPFPRRPVKAEFKPYPLGPNN